MYLWITLVTTNRAQTVAWNKRRAVRTRSVAVYPHRKPSYCLLSCDLLASSDLEARTGPRLARTRCCVTRAYKGHPTPSNIGSLFHQVRFVNQTLTVKYFVMQYSVTTIYVAKYPETKIKVYGLEIRLNLQQLEFNYHLKMSTRSHWRWFGKRR